MFKTIITNTGSGKIAAALAAGETITFAQMALGDGGGAAVNPLPAVTELVNENYRAANSVAVDPENANRLICEMIVPVASGGWYIREAGLFDTDGDLIAYANFPETFKAAGASGVISDMTIRLNLELTNPETIELTVDPNIITASQQYVVDQVSAHEAAANPHAQYSTTDHTHDLGGKVAAAYGTISSAGAKLSGSTNWTVARNSAGQYQLNITDPGDYLVIVGFSEFHGGGADAIYACHNQTTGKAFKKTTSLFKIAFI